jgi:hypothetical protein
MSWLANILSPLYAVDGKIEVADESEISFIQRNFAGTAFIVP